jgi:Ribonuclease G/E
MILDKRRHNLEHPQGLVEFKERVEFYIKEGKIVELGMYQHTRSNLQNSSIHLYCKLIAEALNDAGYTNRKFRLRWKL